jgi:hypothetical protein
MDFCGSRPLQPTTPSAATRFFLALPIGQVHGDVVMSRNYVNAFSLKRLALACVLMTISSSGSAVIADDQPQPESTFKVGDMVVVTEDKTTIAVGDKTLSHLKKGTEAEVIQIVDDWIGVELEINANLVKGWIAAARLDVVAKPISDESGAENKPAAKEEGATSTKPKETLADKFAQMMAEKDRQKVSDQPVVETDTSKANVPPGQPPANQTAASKITRESKPDVPSKDETARPSAQPEVRTPFNMVAATDSQEKSDKSATDQKAQDKPSADQPGKEKETGKAAPAKEKEATPPTSEPKKSAAKPPVKEEVPKKTAPPQKPDEKPSEEDDAKTATAAPGSAKPGEEELGEGPEPLAEKFAEILARLRAQEKGAEGVQQEPKEAPAEPETSPPAGPVEDTAEDDPIAVSVLVLRNAVDLLELDPEKRIGRLILTSEQFNNRAMRRLEGLSIASLSLEGVNVSNAGLQYLKGVRGLQSLQVWSPAVDDEGLKLIAELRGLESLDLEGTAVQGMGFGYLTALNNLEWLVLGHKTVDSGIKQLTKLPSLRQLDLRACRELTLDCVETLAQLTNLEIIWLPAQIRTRGKRALREALPECEIRS